VLPSSRSAQIGGSATAFATIVNAGPGPATACEIAPMTNIPATFTYHTTDPATNEVTGSPNTPADIPAGASQSYVFTITPTGALARRDEQLCFSLSPFIRPLLFSHRHPGPLTPSDAMATAIDAAACSR